MKTTSGIIIVISFGLFLASCNVRQSEPPVDQAGEDANHAQQSLVAFLEDLHTGRYDEAAQLYGGNYEIMIYHNPKHDPNDHSGLLRNACTINGTACLELKSIALVGEGSANVFEFKVEFMDDDGTLFVLGPCCGGNETDTPSQSVFTFTVLKNNDGNFVVMEMPPYVP